MGKEFEKEKKKISKSKHNKKYVNQKEKLRKQSHLQLHQKE